MAKKRQHPLTTARIRALESENELLRKRLGDQYSRVSVLEVSLYRERQLNDALNGALILAHQRLNEYNRNPSRVMGTVGPEEHRS